MEKYRYVSACTISLLLTRRCGGWLGTALLCNGTGTLCELVTDLTIQRQIPPAFAGRRLKLLTQFIFYVAVYTEVATPV